jgi:hypothetical protein
VNAYCQTKPSDNYCQQDSRCAAGLLKRSNEHANQGHFRQHTGDELCPLQLTVVFETHTEPFGVVRQLVAVVLKFPSGVSLGHERRFLEGIHFPGGHYSDLASGANGGTLRNVVRCQLRHVALLSGPGAA